MHSLFSANLRLLWRNSKNIGPAVPFLKGEGAWPSASQVRLFAARKGKRAKMDAAKMEKKLKDASKPKSLPKFLIGKNQAGPAAEGRRRVTDENWLQAPVVDNIWIMKFHRGKPFSVDFTIDFLQKVHTGLLFKDPEALVYATVELDLQLKKKNHFMEDFSGTVLYPHDFDTGPGKRVIALCESSDEQFKASEAGAAYVGGTSLIQRIYRGEIRSDDYDFVVCHPDMLKDCGKLRGLLKKRFPTLGNGLLRIDIPQAVKEFSRCKEFSSTASGVEPDFGWIEVHFGRLHMTIPQLEQNLKELLLTVEKRKPVGREKLPFVTRVLVWCAKWTDPKFKIPHWEYLPGYPLYGVVPDEDSEESSDQAAK